MKRVTIFIGLCLCLLAVVLPASSQGQPVPAGAENVLSTVDAVSRPTDQIIIQFADEATAVTLLAENGEALLAPLSQAAGVTVTYARPMSGEAHVLKLPQAYPAKEVALMAARMAEVEGVNYAEPDLIKSVDGRAQKSPFAPNLTPNDPRFSDQWHYIYTPNTAEGLNLVPAWNISTGNASTVVAVLDTGILAHTDLAGKTVPGYDMIDDPFVANDGNGRDNNPADPGDWSTPNQCAPGDPGSDSSWHGTHVAGTIGAATNNNVGVAGVNWNAKILPVRVLGRCGGYTSDIVDGMRWAAGLAVTGVPANANPAKVLNLSLGGSGSCSTTEQNAINAVVAAGSMLIVAAGNENQNASNSAPANCNNVITVAATDRTGDRAYYSNFGSVVEVSGPGGAQAGPGDSDGVLSTLDTGTTTPNNSNTYEYYQGTSMATPHVAGVASLIVGLRPAYTSAQVSNLLQTTARAFPAGSTCSTSICGAGIVDAFQALSNIDNVGGDYTAYLPVMMKESPPPPPTNPLVNPGFESGPTGWTEYSLNGWPLILNSGFPGGLTPHGGSWAAWLGGDYDEIAYVQQSVTIPAAAPYLSYWHWIASEDICGFDAGGVLVNGTVVDVYDLCQAQNTNAWVRHTVNLSAYAGQTVALQIRAETDESFNSNLFVDDVSFQASAAAAGSAAVPPPYNPETAVTKQAATP